MPVSQRARTLILAALGLATLALAGLAGRQLPAFAPIVPAVAAFLAVLAIAFLCLRNFGLAALTALGPLIAIPWLTALSLLWPRHAMLDGTGLAFGFAVAAILADAAAGNGVTGRVSGWETVRRLAPAWGASVASLALFFAWSVVAGLMPAWQAIWLLAEAVVASSFAAAVMALAVPLLPFSEDFIARWNRWDEFRGRLFLGLAAVAGPRWGWSAGGISLVLASIAFFSAHQNVPVASLAVYAAVVCAAALAVVRSWRGALAAMIALMAVPLSAHVLALPDPANWMRMAVIPLFCTLVHAEKLARIQENEPSGAATSAAYRESAGGVVFASLAAACACAVFSGGRWIFSVSAVLAGAVAALFVAPAFTAILVNLLPRRRSVEEIYRAT